VIKKGTFYNSYVSGPHNIFCSIAERRDSKKTRRVQTETVSILLVKIITSSRCAIFTSNPWRCQRIMCTFGSEFADHLIPLLATAARRSPLPRERFSPLTRADVGLIG